MYRARREEAGTSVRMDSRLRGNDGLEIMESGGLLLPGAPRTAGFPFCCPVGSEPRYLGVTLGREALSYAAIASASLSLALV